MTNSIMIAEATTALIPLLLVALIALAALFICAGAAIYFIINAMRASKRASSPASIPAPNLAPTQTLHFSTQPTQAAPASQPQAAPQPPPPLPGQTLVAPKCPQ